MALPFRRLAPSPCPRAGHPPPRVLAKVDFLGLLAGFEALREKAFVLPPLVPTAIRSTGAYEIPGFATRALGSGKAAADKHQLSSTLNL